MRNRYANKSDYWGLLDDENGPETWSLDRPGGGQRAKPRPEQVREALAEELEQPESAFDFTYHAGRHERGWLGNRLAEFYTDNLITDVLAMVKGGKEANVYCCQAHPNMGMDLLAAKIYRPRLLRNLKNDALYKEGRELMGNEGRVMHDQRARRAVIGGSRIGKEMSIVSWIAHEFKAMRDLYDAGADVPFPVAQAGMTILMEFIGEAGLPAPVLHSVSLEKGEAGRLFERLLWNVEVMLSHDLVHSDLSAFNVLYWDGVVKVIDFPQVVNPLENSRSHALLQRDIQRLCQYFARYGLRYNPFELASSLWSRYRRGEIGGGGRQIE
jgi:RIO kinase 1